MSGELKEGIFTVVTADAGLTALIVDRIYPDIADQKKQMPYITYQMESQEGVPHMTGVSGLARTEIQFTIWAATAESRSAVVKALRLLFDGKVRQTLGTVFVQISRNTGNIDTKENPDDGSQNVVFGTFSDYSFWHNR